MSVVGTCDPGLRRTSHVTCVPDNDKARLMYYLDCVCTVLRFDDDPEINRLRMYDRYALTADQTDRLMSLCYILGPDLLVNKCFFYNNGLCGNSGNRFFELNVAETHFLAITDSVLIGGVLRKVKKIMTFKMGWMDQYWKNPLKALCLAKRRQREAEMYICCNIL